MELLTALFKKKISEDKVANIFCNTILKSVDTGFPEVAAIINNDTEFVTRPNISEEDSDKFLMIIIAGNLIFLRKYFAEENRDERITELTFQKLSKVFEMDTAKLKAIVDEYQQFFKKVNYPSKNTHYAMSKAVFFKYDLNEYQQDYFKNLKTPNPIFLKHLDEVVYQFIIDWDLFSDKFKITE